MRSANSIIMAKKSVCLQRRSKPFSVSRTRSSMRLRRTRTNIDDPDLGDFRNQFYGEVDLQEPSNFVVEGEGANDTLPMRQWRLALFNGTHEALAVKWITAAKKARLGILLATPVTIRYYFGPQSDTNEGGVGRCATSLLWQ